MELVEVKYLGSDGQYQTYSPSDLALINRAAITTDFGGAEDYIEYFVKDEAGNVLDSDYFDNKYQVGDTDPVTGTTRTIFVDPEADVKSLGYNRGIVNIKYNFFRKFLLSSPTPEQNFWITEISPSRTEIKVARQDLSNDQLSQTFNNFNAALSADPYYPDFYLNFGRDILVIGVNAIYIEENGSGYILFKLYEALPEEFDVKSTFWVVGAVADSAEFNVTINVEPEITEDFVQIQGPNFKVNVNNTVSQTTPYYNYTSLFATSVTSSYQQLKSMMDEKGILINVDYNDFSNFVRFSSATERLYNFVYKLQLIESASYGLTQPNTTQAKILLQSQIDNTITKFDGYEYFLYFQSESFSWPKSTGNQPYSLYSVTSSQAVNWLGSINTVPSPGVASVYFSASVYDNTNPNLLQYTTPQYIRDDEQNAPYLVFLDMIGQHFDNIWIYLKDVTNHYSAENNPFVGISIDEVGNALKSFGIQLYTNTSISDNIYYSLVGLNQTGSSLPVTSSLYSRVVYASSSLYPLAGQPYLTASLSLPPFGEEKINRYVTTFITGSPGVTSSFETLPADQLTGEVYKRLYHNLAYLLKTRGTERGVRALATTFGIPPDILVPHEYGGYNIYDIAGIQEIDTQKINTGSVLQISSSLLSPWTTIQYYQNNTDKSAITVQAGFSPTDAINASITSSGIVTSSTQPEYFNIMQLIGAPNLQYSSSYTPLVNLENTFFNATYTGNSQSGLQRYNVQDFIRLIKYYNNSFFKMVRDWVPARASVDSGIVIKSHILERSKYPRKEPTWSTSSFDADYVLLAVSGGAGGAVTGSTAFVQAVPIQYSNYSSPLTGALGTVYVPSTDEVQQYNGEFSGSYIQATTNYFSQEEVSSYIYPWTSSVPGNGPLFLSYSLSPTFQNISGSVISQRFLDLDYNQTQLAPTNYGLITQSLSQSLVIGPVSQSTQPYSQYAQLQDYNYSLRSSVIQKYSGSYLSGLYYNVYSTASSTYSGDVSYGQSPVVDYYSNRIGFFTQVSQSSFLPGKTNVTLAYFADVSGGLFELNQNNKNWVDVQNTFKAGTPTTIKQFDNRKYNNQVTTDGVKSIYSSGYSYGPQLYFTSGADSRLYFQYVGSDVESPFRGFVSGSPNAFISGAASPRYLVDLDPGTTVGAGSIYNYLDGENPVSAYFATGSTGIWPSFTASIAGQRTFTVNLGINVEFQDPQTFGSNNIQFSWGAYKNGTALIGSLQTINFTSQYSAGGPGTGSIIGLTPGGSVTILNGPFNLLTANGPFEVIIDGVLQGVINGTIEYGFYEYQVGFQPAQSGYLARNVSPSLGPYVRTVDFSDATQLVDVYEGGAGTGPVNISKSTLNLNYTTPATNLTPGDTVQFRFRQDSVSTNNYTASFIPGASNSYLISQVAAVGQGGYPYASTGSTGFIESIVDITPLTSAIIFNTELSSFTGYQFVPAFVSGGALYTSSLYTTFGDINYALNPEFGDKIVMRDFSGISQELDVVSSNIANGKLNVIVTPQVLNDWIINSKQVLIFLLLKRYQDEQNVILNFNKTPGPTSYGFLLPNTVSPEVTNNINTLQAAVQSQLLSLQSDPLLEQLSGGSFGG